MFTEAATDQAGHTPQRSRGSARVTVNSQQSRTKLEDLFQQGCARVRFPKIFDEQRLEAVMINTAGGITGGDELNWAFTAKRDSNLTVTSQACERLYRSSGGVAQIDVHLTVESGAKLCWLPQETILFDGCSAHRKIKVDIEDDGRILLVEPVVFGREAMGEAVKSGSFRDNWEIKHNGQLVHVEANCFEEDIKNLLQEKAVLDGNIAMATILLLAPSTAADLEGKISRVQKIVGSSGGATLWTVGSTGKLLARVVAGSGYDLRKILVPLIELLNDDAALPKSWAF